ncbi:Signal transduction histidine kinase [Fodinibius salinus]|uniref:histidine kinase n=2 Tax=Fodinibius salinus TaxID=860790 RepID=A0A5D3YJB7_9BACT|nr:Signal transduction histidine kinase [Fodinibius salinus]
MKLNNKILLSNLVLSVIIFLITSIGMYYLVNDTVYDELDNHLIQHKIDLMNQVQGDPASVGQVQELGGLGSYEWIDIYPYEGEVKLNANNFTTLDTTRNPDEVSSEAYRRLATTISVNDRYYTVKIYEEVAAWQNISMTILVSVLAGLLIWILLLYLLNQMVFDRILTPFYDTVDTLETISDPTDFEEKFPDSTTYEVKVLNDALNTMLNQVRSSFEDQKKFIQNASHELLTPLSIIRQKAEKILSNADNCSQQTLRAASEIQQTTVRLSRLSNALLLISRVENKQYELDEQIDINAVSNEVLEELDDFIKLKSITVEKDFENDITIQGNKELIHSAIYNIVQNAVKFSPERSTIHIQTNAGSEQEELVVSDQGPGIPDELKKSLFDRFKKEQDHLNKLGKNNGNGLGLSLVKSICKLHGFGYRAENKNGSGAKITLQF